MHRWITPKGRIIKARNIIGLVVSYYIGIFLEKIKYCINHLIFTKDKI